MSNPGIVIVGAGPGAGASGARQFGTRGYDVALMSRGEEELTAVGKGLQGEGITTGWTALDITDENALRAAVERFGEFSGHLDVLHFNPSAFTQQNRSRSASTSSSPTYASASRRCSRSSRRPDRSCGRAHASSPPAALLPTSPGTRRPAWACRRRECAT